MEQKACRICGEIKPLASFHRASDMRDGHRNECKACFRALSRARYRRDPGRSIAKVKAWQQENAEYLNAYRRARRELPEVKRRERDGYFRRTYGISADEFDDLLSRQGGHCGICGRTPEREASMHVDHDHESGAIRGLLCITCNQGLGLFSESPERMLRAVVYLRNGGTVPLMDAGT